MTKGFPCLTIGLLAVLACQQTNGEQVSSSSPEKAFGTTQTSNNIGTIQSNQSNVANVKPSNQSQSSTSQGKTKSTNERTKLMGSADLRHRYIVDTSDVDIDHDDCISGDAEVGEFTRRVASALQDFANSNWRAVGITKRVDVNGDGKICWCDFIAIYLKDKVLGLNHEFPFVVVPDDVMFAQLDVNKDGKLEGKEKSDLQQQFASCMTPKQARSIIDAMSIMRDLDETISIQEYRTFFSQPFMPLRLEQRAKYLSLQRRQYLQKSHNQKEPPQQQQQPLKQQQQEQELVQHGSQWPEELLRLQQTGNGKGLKPPHSHLEGESYPSLTKKPSSKWSVQPRPPNPPQNQEHLQPPQNQAQPHQKQQQQQQQQFQQQYFQQQTQKLQQLQNQPFHPPLQQHHNQQLPSLQQRQQQPLPPPPLKNQQQQLHLPPLQQQQQQPQAQLQPFQQQKQQLRPPPPQPQQQQLVEDLQHAPMYYQLLYRQQLNKMAPVPPYFSHQAAPQRPVPRIQGDDHPPALHAKNPNLFPDTAPLQQAQKLPQPQQQRPLSQMPSKIPTGNSKPVEHQDS